MTATSVTTRRGRPKPTTLGVLGSYRGRVYDETRARPRPWVAGSRTTAVPA